MMVSITAFGKPCSGAKTLGWDTQVDWEKFLRKPWNRKLFHLSENEMGE
jgi:hypothetical protein